MSFGMAVAFLEEILIVDQIVRPGEYVLYEPETQTQLEYMVLDGQAL
jgi:hypothetical protein